MRHLTAPCCRPAENRSQPPAAGGGAPGGEEEPSDEELARRMQAEEDLEFHNRMLAMAGVPEGEEGYFTEDDVADPDEMTYEVWCRWGSVEGVPCCPEAAAWCWRASNT